jgi:hypothetical protein
MGFLPDPEKHTIVTYSVVIAEQPRTILSLPDDDTCYPERAGVTTTVH